MVKKRNVAVFVAGLILIAAGAVFLAVNIWGLPVPWKLVLKLLVPSLLILAGLMKLIRHFTWNEEELLNRPGKASLLGGIFWTLLGLVILLGVLGALETLGFFGDYWPLILIIYGMGKIIDYYRLKTASRVRMGEIFGVVFIAAFGWSLARISEAHLPLIADLGLERLPWIISLDSPVTKYRFETKEPLDIEGVESIEIHNLYGDVQVETTGDGSAEIELQKVVRDDSETVAQEIAQEVSIVKERSENSLIIRTNRNDLGEKGKKLNTHLVLSLPEELRTRVVNSYGDIRIEQRRGACQLENSYGKIVANEIEGDVSISGRYQQIEVMDIEGSLTITNRRAPVIISDVTGDVEVITDYDLVRAENIRGNISVQNRFGKIELEEISGSVHIEGMGSRVGVTEVADSVYISNSRESVSARDLHRSLTVDTSNSQVNVSRVAGPVEIRAEYSEITATEIEKGIKLQGRGSEVALASIRGELRVETSLRSVSVDGFSGPLTIQNEYGEVVVDTSENPAGPVRISNKNGGITLSIPEATNCVLSAQSVGGEIVSDFGPDPQESEGRVSLLETKVGTGGPQIELQTTQARIHIRKRG